MSETVASADSYEAYYVQAPTDPLLKPADVVFTQADGGGLISKIILWGTRTWNEPRSRASHVALVAIPEADVTLTNLIEQTWPRQRRVSILTRPEGRVLLTHTYPLYSGHLQHLFREPGLVGLRIRSCRGSESGISFASSSLAAPRTSRDFATAGGSRSFRR